MYSRYGIANENDLREGLLKVTGVPRDVERNVHPLDVGTGEGTKSAWKPVSLG